MVIVSKELKNLLRHRLTISLQLPNALLFASQIYLLNYKCFHGLTLMAA